MATDPTPNDTGRGGGGQRPDEGRGEPPDDDRFSPIVLAGAVAATAVVVAIALYAFQEIEPPVAGLGLVALIGAATLYVTASKRHPAEALGSGLYVASIVLVLAPFLLYIPRIALQGEEVRLFVQNASYENVTIGGGAIFQAGSVDVGTVTSGDVTSIIGLVIFTVIFLIGGLVAAVAGRIAKSYAASKLADGPAQRGAPRRR